MELQPLVGLSADHRRVRQVAPIAHMPEDRSSAGCARARGFVTLPSVPLMAHVDPGEPDSLLLLGGAGCGVAKQLSLAEIGLQEESLQGQEGIVPRHDALACSPQGPEGELELSEVSDF